MTIFVSSKNSNIFITKILFVFSYFLFFTISQAKANAGEVRIFIPSDSKANYSVVSQEGPASMPILTTKRFGSSGISFSRRVFDCKNRKTRYLATGDTLIQMERSSPDPNFSPVVNGSIAYYQYLYACKK